MGEFVRRLLNCCLNKKGETAVKAGTVQVDDLTAPVEDSTAKRKKAGFSESFTFGNHLYRSSGEKISIEFDNEERGIHKQIIDNDGHILHFPGIIKEDFWMNEINMGSLEPVVRYRSSFGMIGCNKYRMIWQIQPDGRYWEDEDGFGSENDLEILLYADLDQEGNFLGPFRIYKMGIKQYLLEDQ